MIKIHIVDGAFDLAIDLQLPQQPASPPAGSTNPTVDLEKDADLHALFVHALGRIYLDAGRYHAARAAFEQARDLRIQAFGDLHPLVAETQNRLASTLRRLGDLAGAHQEIKLAMATNAYYFGSDGVPLALDLAERAAIFLQEGKVRDAQQWASSSARILSDKNDPRRTFPLDLQARALQICGKSDPEALRQAIALYEQILAIDLQSSLGEQHPFYPTHLHNRATVLQSMGELELAKRDYSKAIELWTAMYGAQHPDVVDGKSNLARVLRDKGEWNAAKKEFEDVLDLDRKLRGEDHPYVAYDLTNIADMVRLDANSQPDEVGQALAGLKRAEAILTAKGKDDFSQHGYLAKTLEVLADAKFGQPDAQQKSEQAQGIRSFIEGQCAACAQAASSA